MLADLDARMADAKARLAAWKRLSQALPLARENADKIAYQRNTLEACLEEIQGDITRLESFSLTGLLDAILGQKERKLALKKEEHAALQTEFEQCNASLASAEQNVRDIERQLTELGDIEGEYRALGEEKQQLILDSGGPTADSLNILLQELDDARTRRHKLEKAIQLGQHARERIHSMTKSLGRAGNKRVASHALGALGATVLNSALQQGARGSVGRAGGGFEQFSQALSELDLSQGDHGDVEIIRLHTQINECCAVVAARGVGGLLNDASGRMDMVETVQATLGHLKDKSAAAAQRIASAEAKRLELLENC